MNVLDWLGVICVVNIAPNDTTQVHRYTSLTNTGGAGK
jgi:hypothetical protein